MSYRDRERNSDRGRDRDSRDDRYGRDDRDDRKRYGSYDDRDGRQSDRRKNHNDNRSRSRSRSRSPERYSRRNDTRTRSRSKSPEIRKPRAFESEEKTTTILEKPKNEISRPVKPAPANPLNKIQNEKMAIVKKLTSRNDGDSDNEEGFIGNSQSGTTTETIYFNPNEICDEKDLERIMGFSGFDTTKNKVVEDNHQGASTGTVAKHKKRVYRQYMNRRGGYNRPLQQLP